MTRLLASPTLAQLHTEAAARAIAAAAHAAGKPHEAVTRGLQELAGKVAAGLVEPTLRNAVAFVLAARVGPGIARCGPEERARVHYPPADPSPPRPPPTVRELRVLGAEAARITAICLGSFGR